MRLAVASPFVDRRHGTERALAELLERLARAYQCEIHLYAQHAEDLRLKTPPPASQPGSILWHKVPSVPGPQLLQFSFWMVMNSLVRGWDRYARGLRFDLVVSPGINCFDADVIIVHALFHRLRELAREPSVGPVKLSFFRRLHRRLYYALLAQLERRLYGNPHVALAAVSERIAALLKQYFHRQGVTVIPNAVDTAQFSRPARLALRSEARRRRDFREDDFVLLLIGNDWPVKGLETLLRAASSLAAQPLRVLIAGEDAREPFRQLADELGILARCHFESPRPDVLDFYAAADLYVSPSLEDSFGLPVAEAMACGLPAVSSLFAGASELIDDGVDGFILRDPRNPQELAGLLNELFHNVQRRECLGEAAAKKARQWTWDRNATTLHQLLEKTRAGK